MREWQKHNTFALLGNHSLTRPDVTSTYLVIALAVTNPRPVKECMTVPKCKFCNKPAKKAPGGSGTMPIINDGFYITCGSEKCKKKHVSRPGLQFTEGKKFVPPRPRTMFESWRRLPYCHFCKAPKEIGRNCCPSCAEKVGGRFVLINRLKNRQVFLGSKMKQIGRQRQRAADVKAFDEMTQRARKNV